MHPAARTALLALLLAPVLIACATQPKQPAQPASQLPKEPPMSQPTSTPTAPAPSTKPAQPRDYTFAYRVEGGGEHTPGLYAYLTDIRVHGQSRRAVMLLNRHNGDLAGRSVGLFSGTLQPILAEQLAEDIEATKWADLPQPTKGDVNSPMLHLDYAHNTLIIRRDFNARNLEFIRSIPKVMKDVDDVGSLLASQPARAVNVAVARTSSGFNLTITNVGTGPVIIADPRPNAKGEGARATIQVAESPQQQPGSFALPPVWKPLALQPRDAEAKAITLAPGKAFTAESVAWTEPPNGGKFVAQAQWSDYAGPQVEAKEVMPMVPDPQSDDSRPYVVRGAAFSRFVNFTVEKK